MPVYKDLLVTLEKLKSDVAIFRKVVLHAHSPYSYDFKSDIDESQFIDTIKATKLNMIAITDHMKCDFSCRFSESTTPDFVCILPGIEINLRPVPPWDTFRLHILAIFPEKYSLEQIWKIMPLNISSEKKCKGTEEIKNVEISEFIKTVHNCGGLCIAAHIDNESGVRKVFRQLGRNGIVLCDSDYKLTRENDQKISENFKNWLLPAKFDAIEVSKYEHKEHYRWISDINGKTISIPVLLTNDAHTMEDIAREDRITYIKMTTVGFKDLKQALQFPDTRIRFPNDVPPKPSPRIIGMEINSGNKKGFFKNFQIVFSDNISCLIGPRGSGKSTIIEALRYVFGYNKTLDQIEQPGADLAKKARSLQKATLTNCVIRVIYCDKDNEISILEATYDSKQDYNTRVYTKHGDDREIYDVEACGKYPLRLFGWSELETLGREAHRQRELLDRLIPGLYEKLEQRKELRSNLKKRRIDIESSVSNLFNIMARNKGEIKRYKEYKADFEKLNTPEVKELFSELDIMKSKEVILEKLNTNNQNWLDALKDAKDRNIIEGIDELLSESSEELISWWNKKKNELKIDIRHSEVQTSIDKGLSILKNIMCDLEIDIQKIKEYIQNKDKTIREKVSEEVAKQVIAELRRTAEERLQRVKKLKRDYKDEWDQFNNHLKGWNEIAKSLNDIHDEISGKRAQRRDEIENSLNQFGSKEMTISIRFNASCDKKLFESHIRDSGFLSRDLHGNYKANRWPEKIATACTPVELAEAILTKKQDQLIKGITLADGAEIAVDDEMAQKLIDTLYPFDIDDNAEESTVDDQKIKKILSIAEVEWDDEEGILLNERPVEHLSPGQRSSAMLPLIALVENAPLIIDQPEDNLDNRLIGKMLVDILADLKEHRQIIVATHNPNIVVSGDAEQVIVLDALSDSEGKCECTGSIDKKEIVDAVIDIMEGGEQAFRNRSLRYKLN